VIRQIKRKGLKESGAECGGIQLPVPSGLVKNKELV
jgi:hypothetical protein